jgi:hypothetical protein
MGNSISNNQGGMMSEISSLLTDLVWSMPVQSGLLFLSLIGTVARTWWFPSEKPWRPI